MLVALTRAMSGQMFWWLGAPGPPSVASFLVTLLVILQKSPSTSPTFTNHKGTRFVLAFIENRFLVDEPVPKVFIVPATGQVTSVTISIPLSTYPDVELTINPGAAAEHSFDYELHLLEEGLNFNKAVLIETDALVTVEAASMNDLSSDAFLVLPAHALGSEYVVMSYVFTGRSTGQQQGPSIAAVIALSDVDVVFEFPDLEDVLVTAAIESYVSGNRLKVNLYQYDTFQVRSKYFRELTGTKITSTGPISVISGSMWTSVGRELMGDHMVENLPQVTTWGTSFYVTPIANRTGGDVIRVLGHAEGTQVRVLRADPSSPGGSVLPTKLGLNSKGFVDIESASDSPLYILASRRVLVAQFSKSHSVDDNRYSDPFMVLLPPRSQYANDYFFTTITTRTGQSSFSHFLGLVCETSALDGLRLNGLAIVGGDLFWGWVTIAGSAMSAATLALNGGTYSLKHTDADVTFSAILYGLKFQESYALPVGQRLRLLTYREICLQLEQEEEDFFDNDCDGLFDEEILNGIDDDGDGLIDEDVFNRYRARSQDGDDTFTYLSVTRRLGEETTESPTTTVDLTSTEEEGTTTIDVTSPRVSTILLTSSTEEPTTTQEETTSEEPTTTEAVTSTSYVSSTPTEGSTEEMTSTSSMTTVPDSTTGSMTTMPPTTTEAETTTMEAETTTTEPETTTTEAETTATTTAEATSTLEVTTESPTTPEQTTEAATTTALETTTEETTTTVTTPVYTSTEGESTTAEETTTTTIATTTIGESSTESETTTPLITSPLIPTSTLAETTTSMEITSTEMFKVGMSTTDDITTTDDDGDDDDDDDDGTTVGQSSTGEAAASSTSKVREAPSTETSSTVPATSSSTSQVSTEQQQQEEEEQSTTAAAAVGAESTTWGSTEAAGGARQSTTMPPPHLGTDPLLVTIPLVILLGVPAILMAVLVFRSAVAAARSRQVEPAPPPPPPVNTTATKPPKPKVPQAAVFDAR